MLETQPRATVRTIVASFLFTDLVGFSKGTAAEQYAAKASFSTALRRHLAPLSERDYWIKDTGDGALIAFVSNPEHALYMALALGHDYGGSPSGEGGPARLRTGLHLGTVKESIDVEARRNFIGDGINAAKRIMDFAAPGEIAASRAFFEAIANLDAAYAALFRHVGAPDDKHGRAHELYALAPSDSVLEKLRNDIAAEAASLADADTSGAAAAAKPPGSLTTTAANGRRRWPALLIGVAAMLVIATVLVVTRGRDGSPPTMSPANEGAPAREATATKQDAGPAKREDTLSAKPDAAAPPTPRNAAPAGPAMPESGKSASSASVNGSMNPAVAAPPKPAAIASPPSTGAADRASTESVRGPAVSQPARPNDGKPKPSATATTSAEKSPTGPSSPRCSRILQKAAVGEPLTPEENRELVNTCR